MEPASSPNSQARSQVVSVIVFSVLVILLAAAAFGAGYLVHARQAPAGDFPLLQEAYRILQNHGLKDIPSGPALEYGMIRGMLEAYTDPFSVFVEPAQHELESNALQGSFGGIGVDLNLDADGYIQLFPFPSGPAITAGVQEGDRLLQVDDTLIPPNTPVSEVQSAIRGPVGKKVALILARKPDFTPFTVEIKRQEVALPTVTHRLDLEDPRVGILKINLIAATTVSELQDSVHALQERGAVYFILDLRDNPGGLLEAGVDVARLFLPDGEVISRQYRGQQTETYPVSEPGSLADLPLAVLINHGSASAAEIVAGAIQAHQRAPLVGAPSFGKDSIQLVFTLSDESSLHITAARWWVPGLDYPFAGDGLQPDIPVEPPAGEAPGDPALQAAVQTVVQLTPK